MNFSRRPMSWEGDPAISFMCATRRLLMALRLPQPRRLFLLGLGWRGIRPEAGKRQYGWAREYFITSWMGGLGIWAPEPPVHPYFPVASLRRTRLFPTSIQASSPRLRDQFTLSVLTES